MDLVLRVADEYVLDNVWACLVPFNSPADDYLLHTNASATALQPQSAWPRDYMLRQLLSIIVVTVIGIHFIYFVFSYLSFQFLFDHELMRHPRFRKNQVKLEIQASLKAFPGMIMLSLPWFQAEVMGYSQLYDNISERGWLYFAFSILLFLVFTDTLAYLIHRTLHHPILFKKFHKLHHKWIIPTPFASHALHPVEGHLLALPFHLPIFLFPLHRGLYVFLFIFANLWGNIIHDTDIITGHPLERFINGPTQHALHHFYMTVNYGQFFTWADRVGGSYRHPEHLDPLLQVSGKKTQ